MFHLLSHLWRDLSFGAVSGLGICFHFFDDEIFGDVLDVAASAEENGVCLLGLSEDGLLLVVSGSGSGGVDLNDTEFVGVFFL